MLLFEIFNIHVHFAQNQCSDFKAGDVLRSRSRYCALDETAVFGAVCRHDFPLAMLNLKHGERYNHYVCIYIIFST